MCWFLVAIKAIKLLNKISYHGHFLSKISHNIPEMKIIRGLRNWIVNGRGIIWGMPLLPYVAKYILMYFKFHIYTQSFLKCCKHTYTFSLENNIYIICCGQIWNTTNERLEIAYIFGAYPFNIALSRVSYVRLVREHEKSKKVTGWLQNLHVEIFGSMWNSSSVKIL